MWVIISPWKWWFNFWWFNLYLYLFKGWWWWNGENPLPTIFLFVTMTPHYTHKVKLFRPQHGHSQETCKHKDEHSPNTQLWSWQFFTSFGAGNQFVPTLFDSRILIRSNYIPWWRPFFVSFLFPKNDGSFSTNYGWLIDLFIIHIYIYIYIHMFLDGSLWIDDLKPLSWKVHQFCLQKIHQTHGVARWMCLTVSMRILMSSLVDGWGGLGLMGHSLYL